MTTVLSFLPLVVVVLGLVAVLAAPHHARRDWDCGVDGCRYPGGRGARS